MLHGEERRARARGDADLLIDMLYVVVHGALGERESLCHLPVGLPARNELQYIDLAFAQPCHSCSPRRAYPVPRRRQHRSDRFIVEESRSHLLLQLRKRRRPGLRWPVWARLHHGVI